MPGRCSRSKALDLVSSRMVSTHLLSETALAALGVAVLEATDIVHASSPAVSLPGQALSSQCRSHWALACTMTCIWTNLVVAALLHQAGQQAPRLMIAQQVVLHMLCPSE